MRAVLVANLLQSVEYAYSSQSVNPPVKIILYSSALQAVSPFDAGKRLNYFIIVLIANNILQSG